MIGRDFAGASAEPGAGLWLAVIGGVLVILAGAAGLTERGRTAVAAERRDGRGEPAKDAGRP